jgi:hypothetical protein
MKAFKPKPKPEVVTFRRPIRLRRWKEGVEIIPCRKDVTLRKPRVLTEEEQIPYKSVLPWPFLVPVTRGGRCVRGVYLVQWHEYYNNIGRFE